MSGEKKERRGKFDTNKMFVMMSKADMQRANSRCRRSQTRREEGSLMDERERKEGGKRKRGRGTSKLKARKKGKTMGGRGRLKQSQQKQKVVWRKVMTLTSRWC